MGDVSVAKDEIPNDDEVIAIVDRAGDAGISPSEVLAELVAGDHNRADSQRAMQRVLDRGKIAFNTTLKLIAVRELVCG
jgi:hypothetical protein